MWVAKNKDGVIKLYFFYPVKCEDVYSGTPNIIVERHLFPELTFEDGPVEVELISKKDLERLQYRASQAPTAPYMGEPVSKIDNELGEW